MNLDKVKSSVALGSVISSYKLLYFGACNNSIDISWYILCITNNEHCIFFETVSYYFKGIRSLCYFNLESVMVNIMELHKRA